MNLKQLGATNLQITPYAFGSAAIGNLYEPVTTLDAFTTLDACYNAGINYFDTAAEYGYGLAERRLGDFLRDKPKANYVISTKVGLVLKPIYEPHPASEKFLTPLMFSGRHDFSYDAVMRSYEDSLQRLGLNKVDIIYLHDLDHIILGDEYDLHFKIAMNSGVKALEELRSAKLISAYGMGVKQWQCCQQAMEYADFDCFMLQGNYTLLEQSALQEFLPLCLSKNIGILIAGPFASGILASGAIKGAMFNHKLADESVLNKVKQLEKLAAKYQVPLAAIALQFPLRHEAITSVVTSMRHLAEVQYNLSHINEDIPPALWEELTNEKYC